MHILDGVTKTEQYQMLTSSTLAFTFCFAVWTIFSIIGLQIKADLGLNDTQFGILVATPISCRRGRPTAKVSLRIGIPRFSRRILS